MRLAVVIVFVLLLAARFELSIRSGPDAGARTAGSSSGFSIKLRLGGLPAWPER